MRKFSIVLLFGMLWLIQSCNFSTPEVSKPITQEEIDNIKQESKELVQKVFNASNNMDFISGLNYYSKDSESLFVTDGVIYSLAELEKSYKEIGSEVEEIHNQINKWNIQVLSNEVVTVALEVNLKLKLKGIKPFTGDLIWTATLNKKNDKWLIMQSHESWLNCAQVASAFAQREE